ncbi:MAG: winged helix-turn-helix domain-containing protein [Defluviitaleaceae bacterium]|nr:winged helix-turn-helix domain-containing protein [Defluviitaleaceae bacterium]
MKYDEKNINLINCGDIILYVDRRTAYCNEREIILTKNEFEVFHYLLKNQNKAITREELLNSIWGYTKEIETRATDDTVKRLRRKLAAVNSKLHIKTLWGHGFIIKEENIVKIKLENNHKKFDKVNISEEITNAKILDAIKSLKESTFPFFSDNLIFELRARFINLNTSHDIEKMKSLQRDCEDYLANNKDNAHKHIENTIHMLKALIDYNLHDNRKSAYEKIIPMLENLQFGEKTGLFESCYNRNLLVYSISLAKDYKQANLILNIIIKSFEAYPVKESLKMEYIACSYINFAENLIYSNLYDEHTSEEKAKIKNLFKEIYEKTRKILFEEDREDLLVLLSIKEITFYSINSSLKTGEELNEIRKKLIQKEVDFLVSIDEE